MGVYEIVKPCTYVADNKIIIHKSVGKIVELDDEVGAAGGDCLRRLGAEPVESVPDSESEVPADSVPDPQPREPDVAPTPEHDPEPVRRARRGSDG